MPTTNLKNILGMYQNPDSHWVGDGFPVRTMFSSQQLGERISPFLLLDYGGPLSFPPTDKQRGVDEHPHKGFETVTIVYQGELEHRDSTGKSGRIGPGDVQWMTAASGIVHEEKHAREFAQKGGMMEMMQLWVNLPAKYKSAPPGYQTLLNADIPVVQLPEAAGSIRIIAGEFKGIKGSARTFTPINVWDMRLKPQKKVELSLPDGFTTAIVVLRGKILLNNSRNAGATDFVLFDRPGDHITIDTLEESTILVLNGEPINEPVVSYGPFVMNTMDEIARAIEDYQTGKMGRLDRVR